VNGKSYKKIGPKKLTKKSSYRILPGRLTRIKELEKKIQAGFIKNWKLLKNRIQNINHDLRKPTWWYYRDA
jgi:hypothetical protein